MGQTHRLKESQALGQHLPPKTKKHELENCQAEIFLKKERGEKCENGKSLCNLKRTTRIHNWSFSWDAVETLQGFLS